MRQRQFSGPQLPKALRDQIGDPANLKNGRGRNGPLNRKERRKAEREEKKGHKKQAQGRNGFRHKRTEPESEDEEADGFSEDDFSTPEPVHTRPSQQKPLKSILKKTNDEDAPERKKAPSPSPPHRISKAVRDRLAEDDAEIAALEKKLGIKGKNSKSGFDDGLDELFRDLDALDSPDDTGGDGQAKRKRGEDEEWLASKRRKALNKREESSEDEGSDEGGFDEASDDDRGSGLESDMESDIDEEMDEDDDSFNGFESGEEDESVEDVVPEKPRVRENPYVAPVASDTPQPAKYIPPALRAPPSSDAEALARLRRQIQGLLNRLSDANMLTILRDIEQVYQSNARGYVTTTLVDLLVGQLTDETVLLDTFILLHSGFMAAIFKVIGTEFSAQLVERIVSEFDKYYPTNKTGTGKQTTNLISVVSELYMFQVIGTNLVFDYIKFFLEELSEINTELLLRIVKVSGPQLRQDDPTSLKDIVLLLQKSVAKVGESKLPVRTKFMIETINNLKNNRMKTGVAASAIVSEHRTRMKKQLGSLNTRNIKGTEPLRIGLSDIKNTEKKGKWWLVGASWRNDPDESVPSQKDEHRGAKTTQVLDLGEDDDVDLLQLAREQRMNTDVRRAIFITIMSASDYNDAHMRLLRLNLKKSQEAEIPRIIVHCAGCEKTYNPYYTFLARKFCGDHKPRKSFQFALWDVFKSLGEQGAEGTGSDDEDESGNVDLSLRKLVNLGKLYGTLIANDCLSIACLKPLSFQYLKPKTQTFIEILLFTVIMESQKGAKGRRDQKKLLNIFVNADTAPEMIPGLQYFLKKVVRKTKLTTDKGEKETVQWACQEVAEMLTRLMSTMALDED
ncbi:uncharacterized protein EI97DRAFT_469157 [Westerdykella ornata]|uniref:MI domain-containing protein n=1 Tax=Westerdykella ornata TaxID=318751 RepID=A0A6A6JBC9_WESOR|nr:uncharacterized protein EI97DRAFT_469157 [Westerdykella ornata]KAF2273920.1 hypothetical protein EI97DRAFT_469157 [Westerdykella ornata]